MLEYDRSTHEIRRRIAARAMRCDAVAGKRARHGDEARRRTAILASARNQARNDKNLLRRNLTNRPAAAEVLATLDGCTDDHACGSAACATCTTMASLIVAPLVSDLIAGHPGPWFYATIINTCQTIPQGRLVRHRLYDEFEAKLHAVLAELGATAIGTLEISCNEHHAGVHGPRYVEHAHLFTRLHITKAIRSRLKAVFPKSKGVKRPLKVRPYDRSDDAIEYGMKTHVVRRIQLPRTREDGTRSIFSTRKRRLRGPQRVEVAIATYRRAAIDQLFVHGIRLVDTRCGVRLMEDDHHG